jgi:hypothetical protein
MVKATFQTAIFALPLLLPPALPAASRLLPDNVTVGQHLQIIANVALEQASPAGGVKLTLTSSEPKMVLFSRSAEAAGSPTLELLVREGQRNSPEFYIQGHARSGSVKYTASAPGFDSGTGTVTLAPSGVVFARSGTPIPDLRTTTGAGKLELAVYSVLLDSDLSVVHPQPVAGGLAARVELSNSDHRVVSLALSSLTIPGGSASESLHLRLLSAGAATLSAIAPHGFSNPAQFAKIAVTVTKPGIGITDDIAIGHNLEAHGTLTLGEVAPAEGVVVTLASSDPAKLLLSRSPTEPGSERIKLEVPGGGFHGSYYLHALTGAGTVTYKATAPGFRDREATVALTPSGLVIGGPQGPPDEAELLSKEIAEGPHGFVTSMSVREPTMVSAYTVQLDPTTHRGADLTVQAVRPGVSIRVALTNSNPLAGKLQNTDLTIAPGVSSAVTRFVPQSAGVTQVSVATPTGYTQARNSTSLTITVKP